MRNFKEKLIRFMYGRYGTDQLYYALLILCFVFLLVNAFVRIVLLDIIAWAILILMIYRTFSRNIYKRQSENRKFLKIWNPIKSKFSLLTYRIKEIKTHRYRKCSNCKAVIRLPLRKGKHIVNCPRCHEDFNVHIVF